MTFSYEQQVLAWLQQQLNEQPIGQGDRRITIDEARLEPGRPEGDLVVILFREARRPHRVFGFRTPAREPVSPHTPDPPPETVAATIFGNLMERVEAADMGLPKNCDASDITWI
jgi:hypothetical protein